MTKADHFISTAAKVFINDWSTIRNLIAQHARLTSDQSNDEDETTPQTLLSERQLNDALSGPYHKFFRQKLSAYAKLGRLRLELTLHQEDAPPIANEDDQQPSAKFTALLNDYSLGDVDKMQSELEQLSEAHYQQWQEHAHQWNKQLLASLSQHAIPLTDSEVQILHEKEPLTELIARFTDLNIDLPKFDYSACSYTNYLKLKLELALRSSLSRRHETHTAADIERLLKKFASDFNDISRAEKALSAQQRLATYTVVQPTILPAAEK